MGKFKLFGQTKKPKTPMLHHHQGVEVMLDEKIFGKLCKSKTMPVSFVFGSGGVGDYINWCSAIRYVVDKHKHVDGRVYVSELFLHVAEYLFKDAPRWKVLPRSSYRDNYERGSLVAFPKPGTQLVNACGAHLLDLGFMYFCCMHNPPPEYNFLTEINYQGEWKWPELDKNSAYAIFTPGSTSPVREMPQKAFNEIVAYTKSLGITPVFLGKKELSNQYQATFGDYDFSQGIDLRERTSLLEATQIMQTAKFVIGIDNGLLHMAGTTSVPVIFGHNIASLEHRILRRKKGHTINLVVKEEDLACIGCQSKMRFLYHHDFKKCLFEGKGAKDKACLTHLFQDESKLWKYAIDEILKATK